MAKRLLHSFPLIYAITRPDRIDRQTVCCTLIYRRVRQKTTGVCIDTDGLHAILYKQAVRVFATELSRLTAANGSFNCGPNHTHCVANVCVRANDHFLRRVCVRTRRINFKRISQERRNHMHIINVYAYTLQYVSLLFVVSTVCEFSFQRTRLVNPIPV